jgi:hypothetical protein
MKRAELQLVGTCQAFAPTDVNSTRELNRSIRPLMDLPIFCATDSDTGCSLSVSSLNILFNSFGKTGIDHLYKKTNGFPPSGKSFVPSVK